MPHSEAMDRIHVRISFLTSAILMLMCQNLEQRLGQHRPVQAIKLVIEDSIESRIVQVRRLQILKGQVPERSNLPSFKRRSQRWLTPRYVSLSYLQA